MKNLLFPICMLTLIVNSAFANTSSVPNSGRTVFVSLTAKGRVQTFLSRMATPTHQIVVTLQPVQGSLQSATLYQGPSQQLLIAEMVRPGLAKLPGEILRMDRFAFLAVPRTHGVFEKLAVNPNYRLLVVPTESRFHHSYQESHVHEFHSSPAISIDPAFLKQHLAEYSGAVPVVVGGQTFTISERGSVVGRAHARAYLAQEYSKLGYQFLLLGYGTAQAANFQADKVGQDSSRFLVISAHLDSVGNAGADDDGAGTISVLAIAQALSKMDLKFTLRVVGFDEEEKGLVGSTAYAKQLDAKGEMSQLVAVINLEMTGYNHRNDGAFHVIDCNENTSAELTAHVMTAVSEHGIALKRIEACTSRSDHAVFWKYNKPAVVISQNFFGGDSNPCYHKACDKIDIVNFDYMAKITQATASAVAGILQ